MPRASVNLLATVVLAASVFMPAGFVRAAGANGEPTLFQQGIRSWMSVVAFLAVEGDAAPKAEADAPKEAAGHAGRGEHGPRGRPGMRDDWRRQQGDRRDGMPGGMRGGPRFSAPGMPPMHAMHGMMPGMQPEAAAKLNDIAERLARIERKLDAAPRMGNPWSPRPGRAGPAREGRAGRPEGGGRSMAAVPPEMQERVRGMVEEGRKRMAEAQEKMEQARKRFAEMEDRIRKLEAEVERLKAAK